MKIIIAGATGAIGQPLIKLLKALDHEVYGITQSKEKVPLLEENGAKALLMDVLNKEDVLKVFQEIKPDIVVDMLTRLPKEYTPQAMQAAAEMDARIRLEGGLNLQEAAEAVGTRRYIAQSTAFYYEPGDSLATEKTNFAFDATPGVAAGSKTYAAIEERVLASSRIEGIALRFGFFYGPGTWFNPDGNMAEQVLKQQFPIIGDGQGYWNFIHIEDAANSILQALDCMPGAYNIVNDTPIALREWLPLFAKYIKAPVPPKISEEQALKEKGADSVYYATSLRGASNQKAKEHLNFNPRLLEWL